MWNFLSSLLSVVAKSETAGGNAEEVSASAEPALARMKPLPSIEVEIAMNHHKSFTSPNPDIKATVYSSDGAAVGRVTYAVSPLFDRLYIFDIAVHEPYRRHGFGLAIMAYLATAYRLPITTIKEVYSASAFWRAARLASSRSNQQIDTLSVGEMDTERARWAHLKPKIDQLDELISDRLFAMRESWEMAVGRGLPDWPSSTPVGIEAGAAW